ncbi:MAG: leucine-rich repeat domain-containing protein, partial [Lachnospiraceae bacterium]|nr:leucine-rich repeat domain-containing protein [Lachnospiraceae bacterium]
VVYCTVCEQEISRNTVNVSATGHTAGETVIEKQVAATCTTAGSYDEVVYCTVCEQEISRNTVNVPATGHTPGEAVRENEVAATEQSAGSYDEVVYCTVCHAELSRTTVAVPALSVHTIPGSNIVWTYSAGTLTVFGTGNITNYAKNATPWDSYKTECTSIVVGDSIGVIGSYAFFGFSNATSVTIGSSVTSIGVNAFSGCSKLTEIDFPASLTTVNNYAFNNCSGLTLMVFNSASAPNFAANALANTKAHYIYQSSWTGFAKDKYAGKGVWLVDHINGSCGATKYSLDRGVMTISGTGTIRGYSRGETPWYGYRDEILTLIIGDKVTGIGNYAFYDSVNLTDITFGSALTTLSTSSFYGCTALEEVTFPASLTTIGTYAFSYCTGITDIVFTGSTAPTITDSSFSMVKAKALYPDTQNWEEFNKVGYGGAIYWSNDPNEEIIGGSCGNKAAWILVDGTLTIYGQGGTRGYASKDLVPWYDYREEITSIVVEDGITSLGNYQFMGCENLTSVYLSNTLTFIGVNAFSTCSSLTEITIPATVTRILAYSFNKCRALETVTFEGNVGSIDLNGHAFDNTNIKL